MKKTIKKKKGKKVDSSFEERVKTYANNAVKVAENLEIKVTPIINWGKKTPMLGRFAIYLLKVSGAKLDTQFTNLKK